VTTNQGEDTTMPGMDKHEHTAADIKAAVDKAAEVGYVGTRGDPTPDENYSVAGVAAGLPVPPTHPHP